MTVVDRQGSSFLSSLLLLEAMANVRGLGDFRGGSAGGSGGRRPGSSGNVRGLGDYSGAPDDDDDDDHHELYTGGEKRYRLRCKICI